MFRLQRELQKQDSKIPCLNILLEKAMKLIRLSIFITIFLYIYDAAKQLLYGPYTKALVPGAMEERNTSYFLDDAIEVVK